MAWYDFFSAFYDASLEKHYREQRVLATAALDLQPGSVVLDLPCGTGQSLSGSVRGRGALGSRARRGPVCGHVATGASGAFRAREPHRRHTRPGGRGDARPRGPRRRAAGPAAHLPGHVGVPGSGGGLHHLWSLLAPGGRCVIVDCHAETLSFQGRMVNLLAGADIRRRSWEPLSAVGVAFERRDAALAAAARRATVPGDRAQALTSAIEEAGRRAGRGANHFGGRRAGRGANHFGGRRAGCHPPAVEGASPPARTPRDP
jgi:SAM-dependent methyltransferase